MQAHSRGIHISRTEIIQPSKAVVLLAAVEIAVLSVAGRIGKVTEYVKGVGIGNNTLAIRQHSHRIKSIIEIVRLYAVSLLRNKLIATSV